MSKPIGERFKCPQCSGKALTSQGKPDDNAKCNDCKSDAFKSVIHDIALELILIAVATVAMIAYVVYMVSSVDYLIA